MNPTIKLEVGDFELTVTDDNQKIEMRFINTPKVFPFAYGDVVAAWHIHSRLGRFWAYDEQNSEYVAEATNLYCLVGWLAVNEIDQA